MITHASLITFLACCKVKNIFSPRARLKKK